MLLRRIELADGYGNRRFEVFSEGDHEFWLGESATNEWASRRQELVVGDHIFEKGDE